MAVEFESWLFGALKPYEFNVKDHPEEQIGRLASAIREFGFTQPIVIDEEGTILAGHGRYLALKDLNTEDTTLVPVAMVTGLTEEQKRAYRIIDNKLPADASWNLEYLQAEVAYLGSAGYDVAAYGIDYSGPAYGDLSTIGEAKDDSFDPTEVRKTHLQPGDLIRLGRHRVLCGDALSLDSYKVLLSNDHCDLLVTDPPYNVNYTGKTDDALTIQNDQMDDEAFLTFLTTALTNASVHLKPGGSFYIFHADSEGLNFRKAALESDLLLKQCLIWNKNTMVMGRQDYQWKHEPILYGWRRGDSHYFVEDRTQTTVWDFDKPSANREHPTMKPVPLVGRCIQNSSRPNERVLDPFLGSGSTLIASEQLQRECCGIELDPKYCQVVIDRFKRYCEENQRQFVCTVNGAEYKEP